MEKVLAISLTLSPSSFNFPPVWILSYESFVIMLWRFADD